MKSQITFTKTGEPSRAKTAWGLLRDVKRVMRREPKRVNMDSYVDTLKNYRHMFCDKPLYQDDTYDDQAKRETLAQFPACGTTGCFAGWVCILAGKSEGSANAFLARDILGRSCQYELESPKILFEDVFDDGATLPTAARTGTPEYAEAVCARIDRFMAVNAKLLKAKRLPARRVKR